MVCLAQISPGGAGMTLVSAGTTAELVNETFEALSELKRRTPGSVSVQAGCDLFIAFMTLFPHEADVSNFTRWALDLYLLTKILFRPSLP